MINGWFGVLVGKLLSTISFVEELSITLFEEDHIDTILFFLRNEKFLLEGKRCYIKERIINVSRLIKIYLNVGVRLWISLLNCLLFYDCHI